MSLNPLIKTGISTLLGAPIVEIMAEKAIEAFQEHFNFSPFEIANAYQESYGYALDAIAAGLAKPNKQLLRHAKVKREFAAQIDQNYLQPFAVQDGVQSEALPALRHQLIEQIKQLTQQPPIFSGENRRLTEPELVAVINDEGFVAITDLILEQLPAVGKTLKAFLRYDDLLGKATLFFLHEQFRKNPRAEKTVAALQREGILVDVRDIKTTQEKILTRLQQKLDQQKADLMQAVQESNFSKVEQLSPELTRLQQSIEQVPQRLEASVAAWQSSHQELIEFFGTWANLLDAKVDKIDENLETLLQEFRQFMQRFELSEQVKPRDDFVYHSSASLELIQKALAKLKRLPKQGADYNQLIIMAGSIVSSTGNIAEAEKLFIQARDAAQNPSEKALASFNLFQVRLRNKEYAKALADLLSAIESDPHYALHDIGRYPIVRLLGAGGMGCVFLCQDQWREKQVVVKCFWEGRKGSHKQVFGEAMIMREIAGAYVPKPLDCGYADAIRQEKPFFVTEYVDGALDGEDWLAEHGKLDVQTGIAVGLEVAKGLQVAHDKGIFHLDLKPANLLFKQTESGLMVKIIDFGLAHVATSLRQEAVSRRSSSGTTLFGQAIIAGTLDYAPPEQLGYGKPNAYSDLYAFGATLYRLMTGESPRNLNPRRLADAPSALFELLCDCKEEEPARRPSIVAVIARLSDLLEPSLKAGDIFRDRLQDGSDGPEMVIIPAGQFRMGDIQGTGWKREQPVHEVSVESFAMGRYPVTVGEFRRFVEATGYQTEAETDGGAYVWKDGEWQMVKDANWRNPYFPQEDNQPVVCVSWNDAMAFIGWLNQQTGKEYRLPTEAQWEYAARAGTETDYWWGNDIGENRANCDGSGSQWSNKQTSPVGSFEPNPFGLYDTVGNVWEWTCSEYEEKYSGKELQCIEKINLKSNSCHFVLRGGSWDIDARRTRSAYRYRWQPTGRDRSDGFRLARIP
jgi:formylglycine-generating enzyme required for sulfatase activity/tetratricopeptide (TPR) repeat protein